MSRRVERPQFGIAGLDRVAVGERAPGDVIPAVLVRPRVLREDRGGMTPRDRGSARRMVSVAVRHEHVIQATASRPKLAVEVGEMLCLADARVDEGGAAVGTGEEIGG